jgi:tetratricopeptide (TPR) repeat protein
MRLAASCFLCLAAAVLLYSPSRAWAQGATFPHPISQTPLSLVKEFLMWPVSGRVTHLNGDPVGGAQVRVNIGAGMNPTRLLETNLQGEFSAEFQLEKTVNSIHVAVDATKSGYEAAHESAEFSMEKGITSVHVIMRASAGDPDLLSQSDLLAALTPRYTVAALGAGSSGNKDFHRALELFPVKKQAENILPLLRHALEADPNCVDCRVVLGLARLVAGSLSSARNDLADAALLDDSGHAATIKSEPFLILGVMETWRGDTKSALGYFLKALKIAPSDALALEEAGRALLLEKNWEAAEEYLGKAVRAGAPAEARLLHVRALLELGETSDAEEEMKEFSAGRRPKDLPPPARMLYVRLQERLQLQAYEHVKSVVDQPLSELVRLLPELAGLEPATGQEELPSLLARIGQSVESFFQQLPNTTSREEIREELLRRDGEVQTTLEENFMYLLVVHPEQFGLDLKEMRSSGEQAGLKAKGVEQGFMRTTGFACTALFFHPTYQRGARFRLLGRQQANKHETWAIAFAQQPEMAQRIGRFDVDGKSVPLLVQGIAWIDRDTYQIVRMRTDLLMSPPKSRLKRQTTEIQFGEVRFKEFPAALWLPREVTVTVEWKGRTFRNFHRYSDFRVFKVETEERRKAV